MEDDTAASPSWNSPSDNATNVAAPDDSVAATIIDEELENDTVINSNNSSNENRSAQGTTDKENQDDYDCDDTNNEQEEDSPVIVSKQEVMNEIMEASNAFTINESQSTILKNEKQVDMTESNFVERTGISLPEPLPPPPNNSIGMVDVGLQIPGAYAVVGRMSRVNDHGNIGSNNRILFHNPERAIASDDHQATEESYSSSNNNNMIVFDNHEHELVEASPVTPPELTTLPIAQPNKVTQEQNDQEAARKLKRRKVCFLGSMIAICIVIILCVVITTTNVSDDDHPNKAWKDRHREMKIRTRIISFFRMTTFNSTTQSIGTANTTSPTFQHHFEKSNAFQRAMDWIVTEDPMHLHADADNLLQRFFLANFYFSTTEEGPWTECNPLQPQNGDGDDSTASRDHDGDWQLCYFLEHVSGEKYRDGAEGSHHIITQQDYRETMAARWLSRHHECMWAGVFCSHPSKDVDTILLDSMNLSGTFPMGLSSLSHLQKISLSFNNLRSSLPREIAQLSDLESLDFYGNQLTGSLPWEWLEKGKLAKLKVLGVSRNQLQQGTLPEEIGHLTSLTDLYMEESMITGTLPPSFYKLTNLRWLSFRFNAITGAIQSDLGKLSNLELFTFGSNELSGTLPSEVGLLSNLLEFEFRGGSIGGTIPTTLFGSHMPNLYAMLWIDSLLSGTIPTELGLASTLGFFLVHTNPLLEGTIPSEIGLLKELHRLDVFRTNLTGTMPEEVCDLRGDTFLYRIKADCTPVPINSNNNSTDGIKAEQFVTPMFCPEQCCTSCCSHETDQCVDTGY